MNATIPLAKRRRSVDADGLDGVLSARHSLAQRQPTGSGLDPDETAAIDAFLSTPVEIDEGPFALASIDDLLVRPEDDAPTLRTVDPIYMLGENRPATEEAGTELFFDERGPATSEDRKGAADVKIAAPEEVIEALPDPDDDRAPADVTPAIVEERRPEESPEPILAPAGPARRGPVIAIALVCAAMAAMVMVAVGAAVVASLALGEPRPANAAEHVVVVPPAVKVDPPPSAQPSVDPTPASVAAAPAVAAPMASIAPLPPRVLPMQFARGASAPKLDDPVALAALIESLRACRQVIVTGHTCSLGDEATNLEIGRERAAAAAAVLVAAGLDRAVIELRTAGSADPLASNESAAGRRQNRRATIECQVSF